jgi:hypothetical protein
VQAQLDQRGHRRIVVDQQHIPHNDEPNTDSTFLSSAMGENGLVK